MAASVYATPPPDLSSEDTALSDASNSSQISSTSSHHSKATKRSIASMLLGSNGGVCVNNANSVTNSQIITGQTTITASSPSRPSSMSSNSPIDSLIDQSKKRRKQTTPLRISGVTKNNIKNNTTESQEEPLNQESSQPEQESIDSTTNIEETNTSTDILNNTTKNLLENSEIISISTSLTTTTSTTTTTTTTTTQNQNNKSNPIKEQKQNNENHKQLEDDNIKNTSSTNEIKLNKNSKENCDKSKTETDTNTNSIEINSKNLEPKISGKTNTTNISKNEIDSKLNAENSKSIDDNSLKLVNEEKLLRVKNLTTEIENLKENHQIATNINSDIYKNFNNFHSIDYCQECGEKFDSELKLSVHILQAHTIPKVHVIPKNNFQDKQANISEVKNENVTTTTSSSLSNIKNCLDVTSVRIKLENSDSESDSENIVNNNSNNGNNKIKQMSSSVENNNNANNANNNNINGNPNLPPTRPDEWLSSMSSLGFPFPPEAAAAFSASNYLSQLPLLGVPPVGAFNSVEGLSRPPLRIFNPEAYCDLCNKEFCNKYFLKTHKANKHGIYDPVTSSNDNSGVNSNQFNQISQVLQMQFHQQQQQQYEYPKQLQQQQQQVPQSPIDISTQQQISQLQQQQQQHMNQQQIQKQQQQQQTSNPSTPQSSLQSLMPPEITVFCDICNKRFTNIFAMKRHRTKAHEIPRQTVSPITTTTSTAITANNSNNNNNTTSPNASSNLIKLDTTGNKQNITTTQQQQQQQHQPLSVLQQNQPLQQQQQQIQGNSSGSSNSEKDISSSSNINIQQQNQQQLLRIPEGFKEDYSLEQEDVSFTPQPRKLSPSSIQQAREANFSFDKLKRLGVINPEAFCDLCCKEYCNKYFLRTHKLKRHGIFIPADDLGPSSSNSIIGGNPNGKENEKNSTQPPVWPPFVQQMQQQMQQMQMHMHQATPLNLMMAAAAAGVPPNVPEKLQRRLSDDSDDESNINLPETNTFKKIRLDTMLNHSENDKESSISCNPTLTDSENKKEKRNEKNFISDLGENNKNLEIPENFTQLMQEGLVNAAAAAAFASAQDPDAVGLDLQKLQTMILQLNDLNGQKPIGCNICGKEMENQFHLQAHIATEHIGISGNSNEDNNILRNQIEAGLLPFKSHFGLSSQQSSPNSNSPEICKQCDREFPGLMELKQHIIEYHGLMLSSPIREGFITPERSIPGGGSLTAPSTPNQMDRKPLYTVTPTSSYCEICNKELCNKYFMKTHMQRMHGIEIENGAQIGGVVCNICNKELCSKYFLRVHKTNSHGIVDEGSPIPGPIPGKYDETTKNLFDAFDSKSGDLSDLGARYFTHYTEVCPLCNRRFRSSKWLRAHLMSDHGKIGVEKLQELAQSMIFSKPDSPTQLKIPNGNGRNDGGNGNITPSGSVNSLLLGGLNNLDPGFLSKASPFPNLFMKSGNTNDESSSSPPTNRYQEYQCSICPFTTPYYAFLFIHERSHTILNSNSNEQNNSRDLERDREIIGDVVSKDSEENELNHRENLSNLIEESETTSSPHKNHDLSSPKPIKEHLKSPSILSTKEDPQKDDIVMGGTKETNSEKSSSPLALPNVNEPLEKSMSPIKSIEEKFISTQQSKLSISTSIPEINKSFKETVEDTAKDKNHQQQQTQPQQQQQQQHLLETKLNETSEMDTSETLQKPIPITSPIGISATTDIPNFNTLTHLANLLNRPASYALPHNFTSTNSSGDGEIMQSFLIEEKNTTSPSSTADDKDNKGKDNEGEKNVNRFVPAVIFLPVRERISNPITVSFTLTPA